MDLFLELIIAAVAFILFACSCGVHHELLQQSHSAAGFRSMIARLIGRRPSSSDLPIRHDRRDAGRAYPLVKQFGFEGIIAKRKQSCYEIGKRSGAWLRYKVNKAQAFVIGGYTLDNPRCADRRLL